ncbi:MAG: lipocalin family protein [Spirosomataceae bacterium]
MITILKENLLTLLVGTWFIHATNFPMWLKGDKVNPTFNYSLVAEREGVLLDEVKYRQNGKEKSIVGYDTQNSSDSSVFVWRGKGLLHLLKSEWKVALMDEAGQWAVIRFSKTLFTPEGVDIISRSSSLSPATLEQIKTKMAQDTVLKKHILSIKTL